MGDYMGYVLAAYGVALVVYGGLTLFWQRQRRHLQARLVLEKRPDV
ncbi:MAG: heme exporter protein CcmD [Magnetococcales bacterium]|nr:heme exporter protein CcmD [Magnetococcales bacterium]MBF0321552.1 heme exporter protein CcmD [Magnetococcales bacterium]